MKYSERPLWRNVNLGGETKKEIEQGRPAHENIQSAEDLAREFEKHRQKRVKTDTVEVAQKNIEEIQFIGLISMFIAQERKELGLEPGFYIPLERVRLFHHEVWDSLGKSRGVYLRQAVGLYDPLRDIIDVKRYPDRSSFGHFANLAHELQHQASYFETDLATGHLVSKSGYENADGTGRALNEALTEEPVHEMLERHKFTICEQFDVDTLKSWDNGMLFGLGKAYDSYRTTVKAVVAEVDKKLYSDEKQTWKNLKRGYYSGDNKALEDIRSVWGMDAYQLLMAMGNASLFEFEKYIADCNVKRSSPIESLERAQYLIELNIQRYFTNELDQSDVQRTRLLQDTLQYVKDTTYEK